MRRAIRFILRTDDIKYERNVDSKWFDDTIFNLHKGYEYGLWKTFKQVRDSFESEELGRLRWI